MLLEQAPRDYTFAQTTNTAEFQALTGAFEIMSNAGWKKQYEKHGLTLSSPLLVDRSQATSDDYNNEEAWDDSGRNQSSILKRSNSWGNGSVATRKTTSNLGKKLSVRQRVLRWNDQVGFKKQQSRDAAASTKSVVSSPSSVVHDGFPAFLPNIDDEEFIATGTAPEDSCSIDVANQLFKDMTKPLDASKQSSMSIKQCKKPKVRVEFAEDTFKKAAVEALMTEIPLSCEVSGNETLLDNPDSTSINLGKTLSLPVEEAANMSCEATTRGYVRVDRLDTPTDTSALSFHSQGSDHKPVDDVASSASLYKMLGLNRTQQRNVEEVADIKFLSTVDGYVKTVADRIEGIGNSLGSSLGEAHKVIAESLALPDKDVGGMLDVLSIENQNCEGIWRDFEKELSNGTVFPTLHKSFTM